jgi:starch synthase
LKYGTVPVVHATGGLVDTITEANTENLELATANGFLFDDYSPKELDAALERAVSTYCNDSPIWRRIIETGMRQDWSWSASARRYEELYQRTVAQKRET